MTERSAIDAMLKRLVVLEAENQRLREERDRLTLRWTTEKPTEPGFYWARGDCWAFALVGHQPNLIRVIRYRGQLYANGLPYDNGRLLPDDGEWAGPIPRPVEATPTASPQTDDSDPDPDSAMESLIGPEEF